MGAHEFFPVLVGVGITAAATVVVALFLLLFAPRGGRVAWGCGAGPMTATPPRETSSRACYLSLLVRVDEHTGLLSPSVQLRGDLVSPATLHLTLVDDDEVIRHSTMLPVPADALDRELVLPAFPAPGDVTPEEALGWHWDVVVEAAGIAVDRWREHPRRAGVLGPEAEIAFPLSKQSPPRLVEAGWGDPRIGAIFDDPR